MADTFVDEETMAATIARIEALVPQMQGELKKLNGEMQSLFGTWKGRSSNSFQRLHTNWSQDYGKLTTALTGIHTTLTKNLANARGADENSTARA